MHTLRSARRHVTTLATALSFTVFSSVAAAQTTRLAPSGAPAGGAVRVQPGAAPEPASATVTAGGAVEHPGCGGYVTARPQLVINVTADAPWLRVYATSGSDTALAVLAPNGQWRCADDTYGTNPAVDGRFRRGAYRVWVATPTAGATASAAVTVTAERAQRAPDGVAAPVAAPAVGAAPQDAFGAATGLAQQVLGGFGGAQSNPLAVPLATLSRAGLTPNNLPTPLDTVLRQPDAGVANLSPAQLTQLAELARQGLSAQQLQSVATGLTSAGGAQPTLSPAQLSQLGQLARGGTGPEALQSAVSQMLRGVGTAR